MLDFGSTTTLSIPRPQHGLAPFEVDLKLAYEAERRLQEIATASTGNSLHLASVFARAYDSLGRAYGSLYKEVGSATIDARKRRARLVLDEAPRIAKEKGLASARSPTGSEDVREAICYQDQDYCAIEEYRAALEAAKELVYIKLQAVRMGFEAVRSIIRGTSSSAGNGVHDLSDKDEPSLIDRALAKVQEAESLAPPPRSSVETSHAECICRHGSGDPSCPTCQPAPARRGFGTPSYR